MAPSYATNDVDSSGDARVPPHSLTGRFASVYSDVQNSRIFHTLPLPSVLKNPFKIIDGPLSSAAGNPGLYLSSNKIITALSQFSISRQRLQFAVIFRFSCFCRWNREAVSKPVRATVGDSGAEWFGHGAAQSKVEDRCGFVRWSGSWRSQCHFWNFR